MVFPILVVALSIASFAVSLSPRAHEPKLTNGAILFEPRELHSASEDSTTTPGYTRVRGAQIPHSTAFRDLVRLMHSTAQDDYRTAQEMVCVQFYILHPENLSHRIPKEEDVDMQECARALDVFIGAYENLVEVDLQAAERLACSENTRPHGDEVIPMFEALDRVQAENAKHQMQATIEILLPNFREPFDKWLGQIKSGMTIYLNTDRSVSWARARVDPNQQLNAYCAGLRRGSGP